MPGVSGVTVVTNARAFYTTRAAAGASGARHSLRPLFSEGRTIRVNLAQSCGEIAKLRLQAMRLIRNHYISSPDRRLFPKPTVDKVARQSRLPRAAKAAIRLAEEIVRHDSILGNAAPYAWADGA